MSENLKRICKMREINPGQNPGNSTLWCRRGQGEGEGISEENGERASKETEKKGGCCVLVALGKQNLKNEEVVNVEKTTNKVRTQVSL